MLWNMKLGTKFVLIAIMLVVLSTAVVGAIGFGLGRRGIETHTDLHLQSVVTLGSDKITSWLEFQRTVTESDLYPRGSTETVDRLLSEGPGSPAHDEAVEQFEQNVRHVASALPGPRYGAFEPAGTGPVFEQSRLVGPDRGHGGIG